MTTVEQQKNMLYRSMTRNANLAADISQMLRNKEMTKKELLRMIERRPEVYGFLRGMAENLPDDLPC